MPHTVTENIMACSESGGWGWQGRPHATYTNAHAHAQELDDV